MLTGAVRPLTKQARLMILRRVIRHVRNQEWTAIGIDFLIVVLGVFLGIQVQEWSAERGERRLERVYLERLLADVDLSIETTAENRARVTGYSEASGSS